VAFWHSLESVQPPTLLPPFNIEVAEAKDTTGMLVIIGATLGLFISGIAVACTKCFDNVAAKVSKVVPQVEAAQIEDGETKEEVARSLNDSLHDSLHDNAHDEEQDGEERGQEVEVFGVPDNEEEEGQMLAIAKETPRFYLEDMNELKGEDGILALDTLREAAASGRFLPGSPQAALGSMVLPQPPPRMPPRVGRSVHVESVEFPQGEGEVPPLPAFNFPVEPPALGHWSKGVKKGRPGR